MSKQESHKPSPQQVKTAAPVAPQLQTRSFSELAPVPVAEAQTVATETAESSETQSDFSFEKVNVFSAGGAPMPPPTSSPIQTKLTIGEPDDKYEQEADQVAARVVNIINSPQTARKEEEVQRFSLPAIKRLPLQRQSSIPVGPASTDFESQLNHARSGGNTLAPQVKTQMESAMSADFSQVKIHTGPKADHLSQSIQAKAFTTGSDVFFKQGEYQPNSRSGQSLLAHELTHVVQQGSASVQRKPNRISPSLIQRTVRGATHSAGDNDEIDSNSIADEALGVADTTAAYLGTGGGGPQGDPFGGSGANSEGLHMGGGAGGDGVNQTGGILGAAVNLYSVGASAKQFVDSIKTYSAVGDQIESLNSQVADGSPGLYASIALLEKEKQAAKTGMGDSFASLIAAANGVCNGVSTAVSAFKGLTEGLAVCVANATFAIGAGLNALIGTINTLRDINTARKRSKKQDATQQLIDFCNQLCEQIGGDLDQKKAKREDLEARTGNIFAAILANMKKYSELDDSLKLADTTQQALIKEELAHLVTVGSCHHKELIAANQEIHQLSDEIPAQASKFSTIGSMMSGLSVSARKQGWKEKGIVSGGLNAVGAAGGAALLAATIGGVAAAATPIGWALSGVAAVGILIYTTGKYVKRSIRNSNVIRMKEEKGLIETAMSTKGLGDNTIWNRKDYPTQEKKGWFNRILSREKEGNTSGKTTLRARLNYIDKYLARYDVEVAGDQVYAGIVAALSGDDAGSQSVEVADGQTKDFKTAVSELLVSLGLDPEQIAASIENNQEDEQTRQLVLSKMKLLPKGKGDDSAESNSDDG